MHFPSTSNRQSHMIGLTISVYLLKKRKHIFMIDGLVQIFIWQGIGELASKFLLPQIPGPVLGLILLVCYLMVKGGEVDESLAMVADSFRQHLALLFVPASVGVVLYLPELKANALAVTVALTVSVFLAIAITALVLKMFNLKEPVFENATDYDLAMKDFGGKERRTLERRESDRRTQDRRTNKKAASDE
jgi:holin-like protein